MIRRDFVDNAMSTIIKTSTPEKTPSISSSPAPFTTTSSPLTLTHRYSNVLRAADCLPRLLQTISDGTPLREVRMTAA
jgi:hypothetical protein